MTLSDFYFYITDVDDEMEAQKVSELASLAVIEQGLCKRDADDPAANVFHSRSFDRLLWSVHSPIK